MPSISRRSTLQLGGAGLLINLSGCFGLFQDQALDILIKNELPERHEIWMEFTVQNEEISDFEKTVQLDPREERNFKNAIPYPDEQTTAVVESQLDDRPKSEPYVFQLTDQLGEFGVTAHENEGKLELYYTRSSK